MSSDIDNDIDTGAGMHSCRRRLTGDGVDAESRHAVDELVGRACRFAAVDVDRLHVDKFGTTIVVRLLVARTIETFFCGRRRRDICAALH